MSSGKAEMMFHPAAPFKGCVPCLFISQGAPQTQKPNDTLLHFRHSHSVSIYPKFTIANWEEEPSVLHCDDLRFRGRFGFSVFTFFLILLLRSFKRREH